MVHRQERFDAYRLRQMSEARLIVNFKRKMGIANPRDVLIAFGDGARTNLKRRAPGPSTAIRRLFQRNHFRVVDICESFTTLRCFRCKDEHCNNRSYRRSWGLRMCENCKAPWDRDYNACLNIAHIANELVHGRGRPGYLGP